MVEMKKYFYSFLRASLILVILMTSVETYPCTIIAVGKKATADGSVIISHTDCGADCRIRVVHSQTFRKGEMTPVHWGFQDIHRPLDDFRDVMAFQRSTFEETIYDKTEDFDWYVPDGEGGIKKSPLATPFPSKEMRELLDINNRRNVARPQGFYGMIAQLRNWLPDPIGGIYWVFLDNAYTSACVPIYAGTQEIAACYKNFDPTQYSNKSACWAIDFVDNLLYLKWQEAVQDDKYSNSR
jgi:dipeptidase